MNGVASVFQHLRNQGGGGGLPVAASDRNDFAGAHLEKGLHLRREHTSLLDGGQERGNIWPDPRGTENHILVQAIQVVFPQLQGSSHRFQPVRQLPKVLPGTLITGGNRNPPLEQGFNQWGVGNPNADHSDPFPLKGGEIVLQCGSHMPFLLTHSKTYAWVRTEPQAFSSFTIS